MERITLKLLKIKGKLKALRNLSKAFVILERFPHFQCVFPKKHLEGKHEFSPLRFNIKFFSNIKFSLKCQWWRYAKLKKNTEKRERERGELSSKRWKFILNIQIALLKICAEFFEIYWTRATQLDSSVPRPLSRSLGVIFSLIMTNEPFRQLFDFRQTQKQISRSPDVFGHKCINWMCDIWWPDIMTASWARRPGRLIKKPQIFASVINSPHHF